MFYVKHFGCSFLFNCMPVSFSYMVHDISVHVDFTRDFSFWDGPKGGTSDQLLRLRLRCKCLLN